RLIRANIDALLKAHNSPLEGCGGYFWVLGRFWGIDGRLAVGIARAETNFATDPHMTAADLPGHNAWGYGHPPGAKHGHRFTSWPDGIAAVTQWLAFGYVHRGLDTVQKICHTWVGSDSPNWITNVSDTMVQLGGTPNVLVCPPLSKAPGAP